MEAKPLAQRGPNEGAEGSSSQLPRHQSLQASPGFTSHPLHTLKPDTPEAKNPESRLPAFAYAIPLAYGPG